LIPCPHCGTPLYGTHTAICYKCGKGVVIDDHTEEEKQRKAQIEQEKLNLEKQRRKDPALRNRYSSFITDLEKGNAGVVVANRVLMGPDGWTYFAAHLVDGAPYAAMRCPSCTFVLIRTFHPGIDGSWLRRGDDPASTNNWQATFSCPKCGAEHSAAPVWVSVDLYSARDRKTADPVRDIYRVPGGMHHHDQEDTKGKIVEQCPHDKDQWMVTLGNLPVTKRYPEMNNRAGGGDWSSITTIRNCIEVAEVLVSRQMKNATITLRKDSIRVDQDWGTTSANIEYYRCGDSEWQEHCQFYSD